MPAPSKTRPLLVTVATFAAVGAIACNSGPSADDKKAFWSTYQALEPARGKLSAIGAALPPIGKETAIPCTPKVATSKLAMIHHAQLEYLLDKPTPTPEWERMNLTDEAFQRMWNKADAEKTIQRSATPRSEAAGLRLAAEKLAPIDTLVVFRATRTEPGQLGPSTGGGDKTIVRNARWEGWAFVYTFSDHPVLEGAFPLAGTNGAEISRVVRRGELLPDSDLLHDAMNRLEQAARARLLTPGCPGG